MAMKKLLGLIGLCTILVHCGGGGGGDAAPAPTPEVVALPVTIKAGPYLPDEMKGLDPSQIAVSGVVQAPSDSAKSVMRDVTAPVQASLDGGQWQWSVGTMTDGDYRMALTYMVGSVPVASGTFPVHVASGAGAVTLTREGFTDIGGGDLDADGVSNLKEILTHTDPTKADTDGDGVNDGQDAFPLDPKESKDSDNDGVGDNADNCPRNANPQQEDVDHDGIGDVCDSVNNNTLDSDGDGVSDRNDVFPLNAKEWKDTDGDGVGDNSDNCPTVVNPDQANTDKLLAAKGLPVTPDSKGDACDDDPDGDGRNVVYIDGQNGSDATQGYYTQPVKTLSRAMALANAVGADVWVAAGDYDVSKVVWLKGLKYYGAYTSDFTPAKRTVHNSTLTYRTRFLASGKTAVLNLQNLSTDTRFDGFFVESDAAAATRSGAVIIDNSVVTLANCDITGNAASSDDAAVRVQNNGFATVDGSILKAMGLAKGTESSGVWVSESTLMATNSVFVAGKAPHATGARLLTATASITNSKIDARTDVATQERATGIWASATAPVVKNDTIVATGVLAEGIYFEKDFVPPAGTVIQGNSVYTGGLPNPLLRDWNGVPYTSVVSGDFRATFVNSTTQDFATLIGVGATGGNGEGNGSISY